MIDYSISQLFPSVCITKDNNENKKGLQQEITGNKLAHEFSFLNIAFYIEKRIKGKECRIFRKKKSVLSLNKISSLHKVDNVVK